MEILSQSEFITETHYEIFYQWKDSTPGHGMCFVCNKDGNIDMAALEKKPAALANYNKCVSGEHKVNPPQFKTFKHSYREPAIGRCNCGCEVVLDSFTNTCDGCERDYNMSGQQLASRSQWGEETGEHWTDCY